jgi:hypothetical protein
LVLHIPNLHKSFETGQADMGIGGEGQGVAGGACTGQLCPDLGYGHQVPESQGLSNTPCDHTLLVGEELAGEDTVVRVL